VLRKGYPVRRGRPSETAAAPTYRSFTLQNFRQVPQLAGLPAELLRDIGVVGHVLPFKSNNYVVDELIDWSNIPDDPMFVLTFPQRGMLLPDYYREMAAALGGAANRAEVKAAANRIRARLNPNPGGQMNYNIPELDGQKLSGMQHKYRETALFFPSGGQTCHAYCTFCFRWPQFVGIEAWKFAMRETELLIEYLRRHPEVTDLLFTGGDPLTMSNRKIAAYVEPLLEAGLPNLQTIRFGTKAFGYWPYRFLGPPADDLMRLFGRIVGQGINLAIMAHFNHPVELSTTAVRQALQRVRSTGAQIRTQSPILRHINAHPDLWAEMWRLQVNHNCIPYYMFVPRDTGAQHYFALPLVEAWEIFRKAYQQVSGVCRTVRGPSMSCASGKVQVLGVSEVPQALGGKVIALRFLQGRNPDWVARPFFAGYDDRALWLNDLKPAFGTERFFFEEELEKLFHSHIGDRTASDFE
jgi:L-lysine 2,3-aminomutase